MSERKRGFDFNSVRVTRRGLLAGAAAGVVTGSFIIFGRNDDGIISSEEGIPPTEKPVTNPESTPRATAAPAAGEPTHQVVSTPMANSKP